jgi:hypothetical protein
MIVAISGLVDGRSRLHIVDGFEVPPLLWCMTIGDPSCKKSPATKPIFTVFKEIEREDKAMQLCLPCYSYPQFYPPKIPSRLDSIKYPEVGVHNVLRVVEM